jgi:hypothetical protein
MEKSKMTKVSVSIQDWEIPGILQNIEANIQKSNSLMLENKRLFDKVLSAQDGLKKNCENMVKNLT